MLNFAKSILYCIKIIYFSYTKPYEIIRVIKTIDEKIINRLIINTAIKFIPKLQYVNFTYELMVVSLYKALPKTKTDEKTVVRLLNKCGISQISNRINLTSVAFNDYTLQLIALYRILSKDLKTERVNNIAFNICPPQYLDDLVKELSSSLENDGDLNKYRKLQRQKLKDIENKSNENFYKYKKGRNVKEDISNLLFTGGKLLILTFAGTLFLKAAINNGDRLLKDPAEFFAIGILGILGIGALSYAIILIVTYISIILGKNRIFNSGKSEAALSLIILFCFWFMYRILF